MEILNLRYQLNYGNISGDVYRCDIYKAGGPADPLVQLEGFCIHSYKRVEGILETIRGASLQITFLTGSDQILNDLNVIEEFKFYVAFFRNNKNIFAGWVLPDGIRQDYVRKQWNTTLTASDGLGSLKNLEYQPKTTVFLPASNPSIDDVYPQEFNILYTILNRVGYNIPIATFDNINQGYDSTTGEPFGSVDFANINSRIVNKPVYINKNENYFDCETILKDILQKYNFIIFQGLVGEELCWVITRPAFQLTSGNARGSIWKPYAIDDNKILFERASTFEHKINIIATDSQAATINPDAIHCNENQLITYKSAIKNFRFDQKWLGLKNYGVPLTDFNYNVTSSGEFVPEGIRSDSYIVPIALAATQTALITYQKDAPANILIEIKTLFRVTFDAPIGNRSATMFYSIKTVSVDSGQVLYLRINDEGRTEWTPTLTRLKTNLISFDGVGDYTISTKYETPEINNVEVFVDIYEFEKNGTVTLTAITTAINIFFRPEFLGIGEFHDSELTNVKSTFLAEPVVVINANVTEDVFLNNLYKNDGGVLVPQSNWNRGDVAPQYNKILELTARERSDLFQYPQQRFEGDVYGFVNYFFPVKYDKIDGLFFCTFYSFNTLTNIVKLEACQAFSQIADKEYLQTFYFEDEKNVLIKDL